MKELNFTSEIDPHLVTHEQIEDMLQFLFGYFAPQAVPPQLKKDKPLYIDPVTFNPHKAITESINLLEFLALATIPALSINLSEFLGLLINKGQYLKQTILFGKGNEGFKAVIGMFQNIVQHMPTLNYLL